MKKKPKVIVHEVNQITTGGVERIIKNIAKYDKFNKHCVLTYKNGNFKEQLESVGVEVLLLENKDELEFHFDILHIHSGGDKSKLAYYFNGKHKVIETIHSPVRSANKNHQVTKRIGVCDVVSKMNHNCSTILNGIDLEEFKPNMDKIVSLQKNELKSFDPTLPTVGRLGRIAPDKSVTDFLLACYYAQQQGYEFNILIVGDNGNFCPGYKEKMKLMVESHGIKNVVFLPNQEDIYSVYSLIDVFLYPSKGEGFGLVFLESFLAGCRILTYNTEVNKEVLEPLKSHICLVDQDIDKLSHYLCNVIKVNVKNTGISKEDKLTVEELYDAKRMSQQYQELYANTN